MGSMLSFLIHEVVENGLTIPALFAMRYSRNLYTIEENQSSLIRRCWCFHAFKESSTIRSPTSHPQILKATAEAQRMRKGRGGKLLFDQPLLVFSGE